jgi:hypothetical protein
MGSLPTRGDLIGPWGRRRPGIKHGPTGKRREARELRSQFWKQVRRGPFKIGAPKINYKGRV